MSVFPLCMHVHHVCTWYPRRQSRALDHLELELQMIFSCHLEAETSNQCSYLPSHLTGGGQVLWHSIHTGF